MANPFQIFFSGGNRSWSKGFNTEKSAPVFNYGFGTGAGYEGGQWQPLTVNPDGLLRVDIGGTSVSASFTGGNVTVVNTAPIPVSGAFSSIVSIGAVDLSGLSLAALSGISGQVAQSNSYLSFLSGAASISSKWQKISTKSYVQQFTPITGKCLVNKVNGYSNYTGAQCFVQIFDGLVQTGVPDTNLITQGQQNFFYEFSDEGVQFNNGVTVATAFDPINSLQTGNSDMFCTIIYKLIN